MQVALMVPVFLRYTAFLRGLGIIDDLAKATLTFRTPDGTIREVTLDAEPGERQWDRYPPGWTALADTGLTDTGLAGTGLADTGRPRPLHLRHRDLPYWFEYLPAADLVYFQYNAVRDHPAETFAAFCGRLFGFIEDHRVQRV